MNEITNENEAAQAQDTLPQVVPVAEENHVEPQSPAVPATTEETTMPETSDTKPRAIRLVGQSPVLIPASPAGIYRPNINYAVVPDDSSAPGVSETLAAVLVENRTFEYVTESGNAPAGS